jgi:hypothetical protein
MEKYYQESSLFFFSGYLNKKGQEFKTWKRRYFILKVKKKKFLNF